MSWLLTSPGCLRGLPTLPVRNPPIGNRVDIIIVVFFLGGSPEANSSVILIGKSSPFMEFDALSLSLSCRLHQQYMGFNRPGSRDCSSVISWWYERAYHNSIPLVVRNLKLSDVPSLQDSPKIFIGQCYVSSMGKPSLWGQDCQGSKSRGMVTTCIFLWVETC